MSVLRRESEICAWRKIQRRTQTEDVYKRQAEEKIYVLDFRVHATAAQLAGLKQYLNQAGIRFEPVPKK